MSEKQIDIQKDHYVGKFIEALKAAPDILKKGLSREEFAKEIVAGAKILEEYIQEEC